MSSQRASVPQRLRRLDGPRRRRHPVRRRARRGRQDRRCRPQSLGVSDAEQVDASGMIVMPGFVDTHRHTWQTPVRGVLPSLHARPLLRGDARPVSAASTAPRTCTSAHYAGSLEALNAGVTTLLDWSHISNTPDHSDAAIQGLKDAGIRAVYAHGMPTGGEWWSYSELEHPADIRRIRDTYFSSDDGLNHSRDCGALSPATSNARCRKARLGARTRARDPHRACTSARGSTTLHLPAREGHARPRADGGRTSATST